MTPERIAKGRKLLDRAAQLRKVLDKLDALTGNTNQIFIKDLEEHEVGVPEIIVVAFLPLIRAHYEQLHDSIEQEFERL